MRIKLVVEKNIMSVHFKKIQRPLHVSDAAIPAVASCSEYCLRTVTLTVLIGDFQPSASVVDRSNLYKRLAGIMNTDEY